MMVYLVDLKMKNQRFCKSTCFDVSMQHQYLNETTW